ncbi:glycosyltransferase [Pullulanibacillus sp. KACC 23026]|uniref:glycosyltransferase n=1 Tax=Pullulanibacillus sp. KACC 23026 TaxID=3028315 RepID=UPI0023B1E399|nr:glycosyltransferase [Pullulanibacillus sp. KACC 23026]WEG13296.1 glycosyltransferase [Pullulanibacillus sp. KACC 23026]
MGRGIKGFLKFLINFIKNKLSLAQKQKLKNMISPKQRELITRIMTSRQDAVEKEIKTAKRLFLNLGFRERGYEAFMEKVMDSFNPSLQQKAIWELAVWHSDQYTKKDAKKSLELLERLSSNASTASEHPGFLDQRAIIHAENHEYLGDKKRAREIIRSAPGYGKNPDLFLAMANTYVEEGRLHWINKALDLYSLSTVTLKDSSGQPFFDSLSVASSDKNQQQVQKEKITVIMPVYNSERVIVTAIQSVLNQSWANLEVIVVDDGSTDNTVEIIEALLKKDDRLNLMKSSSNGGAYAARNTALKVATGDFVTTHDADDWSHPKKMEIQIRYLLEHPAVIGNTSQQVRATDDMKLFRRGKPGYYIFDNMSSFMFRRERVMNKLGYWDSVRFGADSELIRRIKRLYGEKSVVNLKTGPLSFQRQSSESLTANDFFGYHGYFMGARKEYFESFNYYHSTTDTLYYEFPLTKRPFAIPEPMKPDRACHPSQVRHFDVIIVSDFRLDGGSNLSNIEEIKAQKEKGIRTGLVQLSRFDYNASKPINPKIRELLDGECVQMIVYGENVTCDQLILRYPPILQEKQIYVPTITANEVHVIINQTPLSDYGPSGVVRYNLKTCQKNLIYYFGKKGVWYPIGPLVRETLHQHHSEELSAINLSNEDWVNIINVEEWRRTFVGRERTGKLKLGRHSRDSEVKWPSDKKELLAIYPDSPNYEVYVMGGAETPKKVLGKLPHNWKVYDFGAMEAKEFLAKLDVFVYYTHPDWVESFGRVILEAMAVGVPVIIPTQYKKLFGEAAIYSTSDDVQTHIDQLMKDPTYYEQQVTKALEFVEKQFGYTKHYNRLQIKQWSKAAVEI